MKTPRIIHVTAYYPPHLGGQELAVQDLVTQLASAGEQVEVVTSSVGAKTGAGVENGVLVTRLKSLEFAHTPIIWGLFFWLLRRTRSNTIVHLHVGQFFTPEMVWLAARIKRFKYVLHLHCDLVQSGPLGRLLPLHKKLFFDREINGAEVVIVLTEEHRRAVRSDHGYDGKLLVMQNGIGEDFFAITRRPDTSDTLKLLFVGRLSPHKNLTALLEALSTIKHKIALDIIGDGECRRELERLIAGQKLENVRLHGRLSRDEVKKFYATCSALILPSIPSAPTPASPSSLRDRTSSGSSPSSGAGSASACRSATGSTTARALSTRRTWPGTHGNCSGHARCPCGTSITWSKASGPSRAMQPRWRPHP